MISNNKFKIIYADPPWEYGNYSNKVLPKARDGNYSKFKITPYASMDLKDICDLGVKDIAEKDSVLLMWVTMPCLEWGLKVIQAWGFIYKTVAFTWVKRNKNGIGFFLGLGNYTRANSELCMLATKGKGLPVLNRTIKQIIDLPITSHSRKPNEVRNRIVKMFGDLSRIELFARSKIIGWETWGNDERLGNKSLEDFDE